MVLNPRRWSLRAKLIAAGLGVQTAVSGLMVASEIDSIERRVATELNLRVQYAKPLLNAALVEPLLQRDYATLSQLLAEARHPQGFDYFLLLDEQSRVVAAAGPSPRFPLPAVDSDFSKLPWERPDHSLHLSQAISYKGNELATLRYGVSLDSSRDMRSAFVQRSATIAGLGLLLGSVAFALLGLGLTRGLRRLMFASDQVAKGQYGVKLPVKGFDELSQLAMTFGRMSQAVKERVNQLQASEAKQLEYLAQARMERARLSALLHAMRLGVLLVDLDRQVQYANPAFSSIWQISPDTTPSGFGSTLNGTEKDPRHLKSLMLSSEPADPLASSKEDVTLPNGQELQVSSFPVLEQDGRASGRLWIYEDVTNERRSQQLIHQLAERDSLTGLLNRHTFNTVIEQATKPGSVPVALLFIDLDEFKLINDLNGHALGDRMLVSVANALTLSCRPGDAIARWGGDEFAVCVYNLEPDQLAMICNRLLRNVANASGSVMDASADAVKTSCSVGVAWFPQDAQDGRALLAAADQAMYKAKGAGRNTWCSYEPESQSATSVKTQWLIWSQRLNEAFEKHLFKVFLQGIYGVDGQNVIHFEALARLEDPSRPGKYFPIQELILHAEESGKIMALDRMMLTQCIAHLALNPEHPPIAVNISSRTVVDDSLVNFIGNALAGNGVEARRLHLELTETAALTNIEQAIQTVKALRQLGIKVGLDDFGSGFTSFAYLRDLKVDYIKMDGGFIQGLRDDVECQILLKAVVDIAHASGRQVIAEWVENQELLDMVQSYGVDLVQGYLFGEPLSIHEPLSMAPAPAELIQ